MKQYYYFIGALSALLLVCCGKQDIENSYSEDHLGISLSVSAENPITKAVYTAEEGTSQGQFTWATGDKIGVHAWMKSNTSDNWPQPLTLSSGAGATEGTFGESTFDTKTKSYGSVAFFPWNGYTDDGGNHLNTDLWIHLKPEIDYQNASGSIQHLLTLASTIDANQASGIKFKHLGAGIMLTLKDVPANANKVSLTISGVNITGWFKIALDKIGTSGIQYNNDGGNTVSIVNIPTSDDIRDLSLVFPLPCVDFTSFTVKVYRDSSTELWSKTASTTSTSFSLGRGDLLSMTAEMPTKTITVGIISYLLNTSDGNKLSGETPGDNLMLYYGGGDNGDVYVKLHKVNPTATMKKKLGDNYWGNAEQTFTKFSTKVPNDITKFKVYDDNSGNKRWFGSSDASSTNTVAYIFNYSGDQALYE